MKYQTKDRRPIPARNAQLSRLAASFLAKSGISGNAISVLSVVFGVIAGASLAVTSINDMPRIWWTIPPVFILLRLLANMLDGMVAIETGKTSAVGELFNEVPDRISDAVIFMGAGFAMGSSPHAGYTAATLSLFVAYVRALGNQMGVTGLFIGPMSKQQRMFSLIALCLYYTITPTSWRSFPLISWGLWAINIGCIITIGRRLQHIVAKVKP